MEDTSTRLKIILNELGMKQVELYERCKPIAKRMGIKMQESAISQYISGKVKPSQRKLTVLGIALNVSEAWLMGFDVPRDREQNNIIPLTKKPTSIDEIIQMLTEIKESMTDDLSDDEKILIQNYRSLNKSLKAQARNIIAALADK